MLAFKRKITALILAGGFIAPAQAGSEMNTLIEMLRDNGVVSEPQYQRLQAELEQTQQAQAEKAEALA